MELGHLLTRSSLTYPEVPSKACHDSFCQLGNSFSLPWVIYYGASYLHASSFSCIPVICLKLVLFLIPLRYIYIYIYTHIYTYIYIYRVSQEECARLREGVPYVKVYQYNPKHLCPKLNGYGDNGQRSFKL